MGIHVRQSLLRWFQLLTFMAECCTLCVAQRKANHALTTSGDGSSNSIQHFFISLSLSLRTICPSVNVGLCLSMFIHAVPGMMIPPCKYQHTMVSHGFKAVQDFAHQQNGQLAIIIATGIAKKVLLTFPSHALDVWAALVQTPGCTFRPF